MGKVRRAGMLLSVSVLGVLTSALAEQPTAKPIASVKQIHEAMINPSSDAIFDVGRAAPKTDAEWAALQNAAVILAESGNLLMMPERAKDKGNWMKMSRAMVDAGGAALKAAQARKVDGVVEAGNQLVTACETCHVPYRDHGQRMPAK